MGNSEWGMGNSQRSRNEDQLMSIGGNTESRCERAAGGKVNIAQLFYFVKEKKMRVAVDVSVID
jgi:hypothetical protein